MSWQKIWMIIITIKNWPETIDFQHRPFWGNDDPNDDFFNYLILGSVHILHAPWSFRNITYMNE